MILENLRGGDLEKRGGRAKSQKTGEGQGPSEKTRYQTPIDDDEDTFLDKFCDLLKELGDSEDEDDFDEIVPFGASMVHKPDFVKLWDTYHHEISKSDGFDFYDFPGLTVSVVRPLRGAVLNSALMMELAKYAIQEYNKKKSDDDFEYEVLKIEKVNFMLGAYFQYFMTVKVSNVTLGSPIETFQIQASKSVNDDNDREIHLCRPKEKVAMETIKADAGWFAMENAVEL